MKLILRLSLALAIGLIAGLVTRGAHAGAAYNVQVGDIGFPTFVSTNNTQALSAQNSSASMVFTVQTDSATVAICKLGYYLSSVTGTPTNDYRISLQTVSTTTGQPTGTVVGGASPASHTFTPAGTAVFDWQTLDNCYTATRGDLLAIVVERTAVADATSITIGRSLSGGQITTLPYGIIFDGTSTWTKQSTEAAPFAWANTGSTDVGGYPVKSLVAQVTIAGTTEGAMTFTLPTNWCSTFKVKGVRVYIKNPSASMNYEARLYSNPVSGSITALQTSAQYDSDVLSQNGSNTGYTEIYFNDATLSTLSCGTKYAVGISSTASSGLAVLTQTVSTASDWLAWSGQQQFTWATRSIAAFPPGVGDTGNFTETATTRPFIGLILQDITAPAAGGGSSGFAIMR